MWEYMYLSTSTLGPGLMDKNLPITAPDFAAPGARQAGAPCDPLPNDCGPAPAQGAGGKGHRRVTRPAGRCEGAAAA